MKDAMDDLKDKIEAMSSGSRIWEVPDSQYVAVLTEMYHQLKYAQERIVQLEKDAAYATNVAKGLLAP